MQRENEPFEHVKCMYSLEVQVDYFLNSFSIKTTVLGRVYNQQFQGTILLMVGLTSRVFVTKKNLDLSQLNH